MWNLTRQMNTWVRRGKGRKKGNEPQETLNEQTGGLVEGGGWGMG